MRLAVPHTNRAEWRLHFKTGIGMEHAIKHVAVVGAGVMGAGIAAHMANAGVDVTLLDIRAELAEAGRGRQVELGGFMTASAAHNVRTGSLADNAHWLGEADWVIEAVSEKLDVKRQLFASIEPNMKATAILSSNTSTIPLKHLTQLVSSQRASRFVIAHFFNPPRRMRLLELVEGPQTDPEVTRTVQTFADVKLGKGVVNCKDTPGFIANRIGAYWLLLARNQAISLGLDIEDADALMSRSFGIPRSGVFGLFDLIGLDVMEAISSSLRTSLPPNDAFADVSPAPPLWAGMLERGQTGRKAGTGFYKISRDSGREALDLTSGAYRPMHAPSESASDDNHRSPRDLLALENVPGRWVSSVITRTLAYAASLVPEIAETPDDVDRAMVLGYGWEVGPFAMMDMLGCNWLSEHMANQGLDVPRYLGMAVEAGGFFAHDGGNRTQLLPNGERSTISPPPGILYPPALRSTNTAIVDTPSVVALDIGDGAALVSLRTAMNVLGPDVLEALKSAMDSLVTSHSAIIIGSDGQNFSIGANLKSFLRMARDGDTSALATTLELGQSLMQSIKYAPIPVVSAAFGFALGGGTELLLHSAAIVAHAELTAGLVEPRVGVIPSWGGCKEILLRCSAPNDPRQIESLGKAFQLLLEARQSTSAPHARELGLISARDDIVMNIERVLGDAKRHALALADGYAPPSHSTISLSGARGAAELQSLLDQHMNRQDVGPHDRVIGEHLVTVLTGGRHAAGTQASEADVLALERASFLDLMATTATRERMEHTLSTGKPLRN